MRPIIEHLQRVLHDNHESVEEWLVKQRKDARPLLTNSVDLRHNGTRLVPIDTNIFPAGFHLLSSAARGRGIEQLHACFEERFNTAKRVLLIPENHSRNRPYHENIHVLANMLSAAGLEVKLGSLQEEAEALITFTNEAGATLTQAQIIRKADTLYTSEGWQPDVVVVNNDFTSGSPEILRDLSQPVVPPPGLGWYRRRKSCHFKAYQMLAEQISAVLAIDPWWINAYFTTCDEVDFKHRAGLETLAEAVEDVLARARAKHQEYGIKDAPYAFIKADSGTYGMGIMTVTSGEEVLEINKKLRNKMHVVKEGMRVDKVIIQEGIASIDKVEGKTAEPMIYLIDGVPVGGMYRVNASRDAYTNLNATGMEFIGMCDETEASSAQHHPVPGCDFEVTGFIACLAALAAAREQYDEAHVLGKVACG